MIDVITEIAEYCRGFEYSLLGRNYGLLIRIKWEFLKKFKWNIFLLIYCQYKKYIKNRSVFTSHKVFKYQLISYTLVTNIYRTITLSLTNLIFIKHYKPLFSQNTT